MSKIVFFVFDLSPRIDRRINEFIERGYEVEVYGYVNDFNIKYCSQDKYKYNKIAEKHLGLSYFRRVLYTKKILSIIDKFRNENVIFYFFTINVAIAIFFRRHIKFIYEESDMLFDRFSNKVLRKIVIYLNKRIIKKSLLTVFTSEGFAEYYYGKNVPPNICFIPNRVSKECLGMNVGIKDPINYNCIKFGFVGNIRYQSILNISNYISENTAHEFHYFGNAESLTDKQKELLKKPRIYMHGRFSNPDDLPTIYASIDIVVCTYDTRGVNPKYAEPNKLYEAIFFRTPIIVSDNSFLSKKVEELGIGFAIDPNNNSNIAQNLSVITPEKYAFMQANIESIPRKNVVNINDDFFERLKNVTLCYRNNL